MSKNRISLVKFRRKRKGLTNYKKRLNLLSSGQIRLVIRRFLNKTIVQFIKFNEDGDNVLITITSKDLKKLGWNYHPGNLPSAYLTGLLAGKKAKQKNISKAVVDLGLQSSIAGNTIYAALKGVLDSGIDVPCSEEVFPKENRIKGEHIAKYATDLKQNKEVYDKQFSKNVKDKVIPEDIVKKFDEIKDKIGKEK